MHPKTGRIGAILLKLLLWDSPWWHVNGQLRRHYLSWIGRGLLISLSALLIGYLTEFGIRSRTVDHLGLAIDSCGGKCHASICIVRRVAYLFQFGTLYHTVDAILIQLGRYLAMIWGMVGRQIRIKPQHYGLLLLLQRRQRRESCRLLLPKLLLSWSLVQILRIGASCIILIVMVLRTRSFSSERLLLLFPPLLDQKRIAVLAASL